VSEKVARGVCADVAWWADPRFGDEDPKRAQQGRTEGALRAQQGRTKGAPEDDSDAILNVKGRSEGALRAHEGRSEGALRAPKDNRDTNTDTNTDTIEHMSASPPPAVAGQPSLFGQAQEPVKRKPSAADRATAEAVGTFEALEALRLTRHAGGRGLSAVVWVPRVKAAIAKSSAQDLIDAMVWTLHDPAAAFHRGEDPRSPGPDRTVDLSLILRHPEYALRRSWVGAQGPTAEELAALDATREAGAEPPAWVERRDASPSGRRERVERERIEREAAEEKARREAVPPRRTWLAPWEEGYVSAFDT